MPNVCTHGERATYYWQCKDERIAALEAKIRGTAATESDWARAHGLLDKAGVLTTPTGECGVHLVTRLEAALAVWNAVGILSGQRAHDLKFTCDDAETKAAIAAHRAAFRGPVEVPETQTLG